MFGGIVEETGQLRAIVNKILQKAQSRGSLFVAVVATAVGANFIVAEQYMAIVISGKMYAQAFRDRGLHPKNLSRAVEDSATVTSCLVPWNSGGAYQSATLGVPTIAYAPFCFFNWLSPLVTLAFGLFNITIAPADEEEGIGEDQDLVREVTP
jgi:NhaC family Na+:H+ antiporter